MVSNFSVQTMEWIIDSLGLGRDVGYFGQNRSQGLGRGEGLS